MSPTDWNLLHLLLSTGNIEDPSSSPQVKGQMYLEMEKKKTGVPLQIGSVSPKIINGTDAAPNEFPHQVQIRANGDHQCGGTILSQDYILTAAHCLNRHPIESYTIIAGEHNVEEIEGPEQVRNIGAFTLHEKYFNNGPTLINDIAVVRLDYPLVLTPQVHPPMLPERNYDATGQLGVVSGWGLNETYETGGSVSTILQKVTLLILSNEACNEAYEGSPIHIPDTAICAIYPGGGKDSCEGDSGGPLVLKLENGSVGIVSYGPKDCDDASHPGVYTRVSQFIQ